LSRPFRLNCVISFIFYLYLMLYACVQRFDVTRNLKILAKFLASTRCLERGIGSPTGALGFYCATCGADVLYLPAVWTGRASGGSPSSAVVLRGAVPAALGTELRHCLDSRIWSPNLLRACLIVHVT
jgi:hypothetical protein